MMRIRQNFFKYWVIFAILINFNISSIAETLKPVKAGINKNKVKKLKEMAKKYNKLSFSLIQLMDLAENKGNAVALKFAKSQGFQVKDNEIIVIVEAKDISHLHLIKNLIEQNKGKVLSKYKNLLKVKISINNIKNLNKINNIKKVRKPYKPFPHTINGEEISLIGADVAISNGYKGQGIKVAIIDVGFANLSSAIANGELPNNVITSDFSGFGLTNDSEHGTAVAEIIYEMAPNAQLYLLKIADEGDLGNAKDYCIASNIHIINHSVGWVNTEWGDGTGLICDIANDANANGILWVNSAGNSAQRHWQGMFTNSDSDKYHEFTGPSTNGEINELGYIPAGYPICVFLCWNDTWGASGNDYDLELYYWDGSSWVLKDWSDNWQDGDDDPTEAITIYAPTNAFYGVRIYKWSGADKELQLFSFYEDFENQTPEKSLMAPADAVGVFTVGAIAYNNWTTGPVENFSSRGPTQDGRTKPDISGTDGVTNFTYGRFYGTSASSPSVAGAAAIVWSAYPSSNNNFVRRYLENNAVDMGISGKDNEYGNGRANLKIIGTPSTPTDQGKYISVTNITFNWTKGTIINKNSIGYFLQINTNKSAINPVFSGNVGSATNYTFQGAKHGKTYYARVCGTNLFDKGGYSAWSDGITVDTNAPSIPGTPQDEGEWTGTNVYFSWTKANDPESGVSNYCIVISTNTNIGGTVFSNDNITTTNYTYHPGVDGNSYWAKVAAINRAGLRSKYSAWSDGVKVDVGAPTVPGVPQFECRYTTNTNINIKWTKSIDNGIGVSNYKLQIGTGIGMSNVFNGFVGSTNTNFIGQHGNTYYARVCAIDKLNHWSGYSDWSDGITVDTNAPSIPGTPQDEGEWTGTNVYFSWTKANDPESGVSNYCIVISTNTNIGGTVFSNDNITTTNYTYHPGVDGNSYWAKVAAINRAGLRSKYSAWSDGVKVDAAPPSVLPGIPQDEGDISDANVMFIWTSTTDSASGIKAYRLQVGTSTNSPDVFDKNVFSTNYTITGEHNKTYYARVAAINGAGLQSDFSAWSDGILVDALPPVTTISPSPDKVFVEKVTVQFNVSEPDSKIYYSVNGEEPQATSSYEYTSPFVINQSCTIKYFGVDKVGNRETTKSASYEIVQQASQAAGIYNTLLNLADNSQNKIRFVFRDDNEYEIRVYNILGELVKEWSSKHYNAGDIFEWDGNVDGKYLEPNIYFIKIKSNNFEKTFKILVVK